MASRQTGIAVVFGAPGVPTVSGMADLAFFNDSMDFSFQHTVDEVRDEDNEVRSLIHSGQTAEGQMTLTPRAKSGTNTLAQAKKALDPIAPGAVVTFASIHEGAVVWANTTWSCTGSRVRYSKNGVAQYELTLKRSLNYDITTVVS